MKGTLGSFIKYSVLNNFNSLFFFYLKYTAGVLGVFDVNYILNSNQ